MTDETVYDCIIIGAGPGGLQAAIYLGRYNKRVLVIDRGGGRTAHAKHIENYLSQPAISGEEIIRIGTEQARSFGAEVVRGTVQGVEKQGVFAVSTAERTYRSRFVIVSTGGTENLPKIGNFQRFFPGSIFTCIDCDGYRTTGRKLLIIGNSPKSAALALAMKEMYTKDVTLMLYTDRLPPDYRELLDDEKIPVFIGRPSRVLGDDRLEAVEMEDGRRVSCEVIMSHFGFKLNDAFLDGLGLGKESDGRTYATNRHYESTLSGLYLVGPLAGHDQVVIAAGEGATAAIDIKKRLFEETP